MANGIMNLLPYVNGGALPAGITEEQIVELPSGSYMLDGKTYGEGAFPSGANNYGTLLVFKSHGVSGEGEYLTSYTYGVLFFEDAYGRLYFRSFRYDPSHSSEEWYKYRKPWQSLNQKSVRLTKKIYNGFFTIISDGTANAQETDGVLGGKNIFVQNYYSTQGGNVLTQERLTYIYTVMRSYNDYTVYVRKPDGSYPADGTEVTVEVFVTD